VSAPDNALIHSDPQDIPTPWSPASVDAVVDYGPCDPDIWLYRGRTVGLLKKYMRMSVEVGRLPSLLGREIFRSRISSCRVGAFEDAVIFVHDVERSLEQLDDFEQRLIATIVMQEHTHDDASVILRCWRRTVGRRFPEALDKLSEFFLEGGHLKRLPKTEPRAEKSCQEGENDEIFVSDSEETKNKHEYSLDTNEIIGCRDRVSLLFAMDYASFVH
jgi:hypothetical protein